MRHDIAGRIIVIDNMHQGGARGCTGMISIMRLPIGEDVIEFHVL